MDGNIKIGLIGLAALLVQSGGGGWWLSQKLAPIDSNKEAIVRLEQRFTETTMVNMQRDIRVLNTRSELIAVDIEALKEEIRISPTFETTDAIITAINELERNFEEFVDAVEDVFDDELNVELDFETDKWSR